MQMESDCQTIPDMQTLQKIQKIQSESNSNKFHCQSLTTDFEHSENPAEQFIFWILFLEDLLKIESKRKVKNYDQKT